MSCDGTCCNTDLTSLSGASSPTWTTSDSIPPSTTRSRFASFASATSSGYSSYRSLYSNNSNVNINNNNNRYNGSSSSNNNRNINNNVNYSSSSAELLQLDRSPRRRGPRGRDWLEFGGRTSTSAASPASTTTNRVTVKAKHRSHKI